MNDPVIYFLGAGASKHVHKDMPLVNDFFRQCTPHLADSTVWTALTSLEWHRAFHRREPELENFAAGIRLSKIGSDDQQAWIRRYCDAFRICESRQRENLETVFTKAERILQETDEDDPYQRLGFLINFLFHKLDAEGNAGSVYKHFATAIRKNVESPGGSQHVIVSYNYETFLEKEFHAVGIWGPSFGYGGIINECVESWNIEAAGILAKTIRFNPEQVRQNRVLIMKPHGCLSWFYDKDDQTRLILMLDKPEANAVVKYNERYWITEWNRQGEPIKPRILAPLIVPPVPAKRRSHAFLWKTDKWLQQHLERARTVVVIGWSMPDADLQQRRMIEDAVLRRWNQIDNLVVCDIQTSPAHYARFEELFRPVKMDVWDKGFSEQFIDHLFE